MRALLFFFLFFFISCHMGGRPGSDQGQTYNGAVGYAIPADLLERNILETDYTAIVLLKSATTSHTNSVLPGYVRHVYDAQVLETIKGPACEEITYTVMAEEGIDPYLPRGPVVVSLCRRKNKTFYVPDNGYVSVATEDLIVFARSQKKLKAWEHTTTQSVCSP